MLKLLIFVGIIYLVYKIFFSKKIKKNSDEYELVECSKCKTYATKNEAIYSNGRYFCSRECLMEYKW